ncbi:MAG: nucleotidyltransferase, partial [Oscillospiraceae bacterium]|nr:nucleotidyltransferase [Oscillospiraceae bacterium]
TVSMNFWGFSARMLDVLYARFPAFLAERLPVDGLKCEYFLPTVVSDLIREGSDSVRVLPCNEVWHGVTYQEDLQSVRTAITEMKASGVYPAALWD